ncbi:hypothetical protein KFZ70_06195 [Tamlana fucoidanivorans]|uniref:Phage holin family protein n=1 Tax=Allotamlana fucoidanivorans TaxID=2583814 RepID=A0A5C4SMS2_9FLAO|nr:hypothetical protein [Tamlana fucoidanivorans]TNJ45396.1 hypothetical protein FGF67_06715 [Tamlana fucoidanivorans]
MSVIDSVKETNKKAVETGERFLNKSYAYYKLKLFQQLSVSASMLLKVLAIGSLILIALSFFTVALAFKLSVILESYPLGFSLIGLLYLLFALIVYMLRKRINNSIVKSLSKPFFSNDENISQS